jgi:anti-sigma-K factor RskA
VSDRRSDRERFEDLKEAYALGALPDDERRWFENYLAQNPDLAPEVEDLLSAANLLALAPGELEPPPSLRGRLLSSIGADDAPPQDHLEGDARSRGAWLRWARPLAAAAAVLVMVGGLSAWNLSLQDQNRDLRESNQALQTRLEERQTYALEGPGGRGQVVRLEGGRGVLVAEGLEPAPEGRVYEAWVLRDGMPQPAGLFEAREGSAAIAIEGSLRGADAVAVTLEPEGGSPMPTSDILMTAELREA